MKLSTLDQALRASPRDPVLWLRLGDGLLDRGRLHQAQEAYRRAAVLRPHCLIARLKLKRLTDPAPSLRSLFSTTTGEALWGEGWLDPDWDAELPGSSTATTRETPSEDAAPDSRERRVAHVRPSTSAREVRLEGLELVGTAATAVAAVLIGFAEWSLYHTMIGGTLLLLTVRHVPSGAWLRREAPFGVAGVVGLCVVLIMAGPLRMLDLPFGALSADGPLALQLWLLMSWLFTTVIVAAGLRR